MTVGRVVSLRVADDAVLVEHPDLLTDRMSRMMFGSILGGESTETGWICPRRRSSLEDLVLRIDRFLTRQGWEVNRSDQAMVYVQRARERTNSFERTRQSAIDLLQGHPSIQDRELLQTLGEFGWNNERRSLMAHQVNDAIHSLTAINSANFSVPGSGKTATTIAVAATHLAASTVNLVVVIGPLSCFAPWEDELRATVGPQIRPRRIRGSATNRRRAYAATMPGELLLLSYATASFDQTQLIKLFDQFDVMLIVDESHRIKRFRGGKWAPAITSIARHARVRTVLSGTPMPQSGRDLFSQLRVIWTDGELTGPPDVFSSRVDRDFDSILSTVRPFITRTPKSALGLRDYTMADHDVPMGPLQSEIYAMVLDNFRRMVTGEPLWENKLASLRRGRPIRLLQVATNPALLNSRDQQLGISKYKTTNLTLMDRLANYADLEIPSKLKYALDLLNEIVANGDKAVVWSVFIQNLDLCSNLVKQHVTAQCFQIDGRVPTGDESRLDVEYSRRVNPFDDDTREAIISRFLASETGAVLVANPASCSESISLHSSCYNAIYIDRTYDCAQYLQSIDRIHRLGIDPKASVAIHTLRSTLDGAPTVDHQVQASLDRKEAAMKALLDGVELKPLASSDSPIDDASGDSEDLNSLLRYLIGED